MYRADMDARLRAAHGGGRQGARRHGDARLRDFFDDTLRIGRVVDLLNRARMQKEFEERVVADAPVQIERRVTELIDWLVDQDFRQWQAVTSKLVRPAATA